MTELNTRAAPAACSSSATRTERAQEISKARRFGLGVGVGALERRIQGGRPCRGVVCTASLASRHFATATDTSRARSSV